MSVPLTPLNMIGSYGPWAASLSGKAIPKLSFRQKRFKATMSWKKTARKRLRECLAIPQEYPAPKTRTLSTTYSEGLIIEDIEWQLPYGPPTRAFFLKPVNAKGKLPGFLAFHDHSGNKFFGREKICETPNPHPLMTAHRKRAYEKKAWANDLARRGYGVLVHDAFLFSSRKILVKDTLPVIRGRTRDPSRKNLSGIQRYNQWAIQHEETVAQALFCAGTTWPGVFVREDQAALEVLASRPEVNPNQLGCGGLSGGGLRTVFLGGLDPRIRCAVCLGMMTTWRDFLLNMGHTHTWMCYLPHLPRDLDYPDVLSLRAPNPTMVLSNTADPLFTLPEMKRAHSILKQVYRKAGAPDNLKEKFYPGPHKFDQKMQQDAFSFIDQCLK